MKRAWVLLGVVVLGVMGHVVPASAEDAPLATPVVEEPAGASTDFQIQSTSENTLIIHDFTVDCSGTVALSFTATADTTVELSGFMMVYGAHNSDGYPEDELESVYRQILFPEGGSSLEVELGDGYDRYYLLLGTVQEDPQVTITEAGNCRSDLTVHGMSVDCSGTVTIEYAASGADARVMLFVFRHGTAPEPAFRVYYLDPASTTAVIPYPGGPPPIWNGTIAIEAQLAWETHGEEQGSLIEVCTPVTEPTPTETPPSLDAVIQAIIAAIVAILANLLGGA